MMKNRHKQKLVTLSILLFILFNAPIILLFDKENKALGLPLVYVYIFSVWLTSSIVSFFIFKKFDE